VLGLENGADFVVIKKAYRKLSMQYHPDKVAHLGKEFKSVAEEKMKEINAAYDYFKKKYNGN
jgi:DnaJ like chaperone protein